MVWSRTRSVLLFIGALISLNSCVNQLTMHARDGEKLDGKWRFAREGSGLIEVEGSAGELLAGRLWIWQRLRRCPRKFECFDGYGLRGRLQQRGGEVGHGYGYGPAVFLDGKPPRRQENNHALFLDRLFLHRPRARTLQRCQR